MRGGDGPDVVMLTLARSRYAYVGPTALAHRCADEQSFDGPTLVVNGGPMGRVTLGQRWATIDMFAWYTRCVTLETH